MKSAVARRRAQHKSLVKHRHFMERYDAKHPKPKRAEPPKRTYRMRPYAQPVTVVKQRRGLLAQIRALLKGKR